MLARAELAEGVPGAAEPVNPVPTAYASVGDRASTAASTFDAPDTGLGLGTMVHALPSQCSTSVVPELPPTAQTSEAEVPPTPWRKASPGGAGEVTAVHLEPS